MAAIERWPDYTVKLNWQWPHYTAKLATNQLTVALVVSVQAAKCTVLCKLVVHVQS